MNIDIYIYIYIYIYCIDIPSYLLKRIIPRQRRAFPAALASFLLRAALPSRCLGGDRGLLDGAGDGRDDGEGAATSGWATSAD